MHKWIGKSLFHKSITEETKVSCEWLLISVANAFTSATGYVLIVYLTLLPSRRWPVL